MTAEATGQVRGATISVAAQLAAKVAHLALNVVSTLAIVRYLAPAEYGTYVLVLTVTTLAGVIADFGLPKLAVREVVRPGEDEGAVVGTIIAIRLALAVVAVLACQGVIALFGGSAQAHLAAAVASLVIVADAVLGVVVVAFQVRLAQHLEAGIRVLAEGLETALILALVARGASLPALFVPPVVGVVVGVVAAAALTRRRYALRPRVVAARVRPLLREALPLGPALLVGVLYLKLDSFVVAAMRPPQDLGLYGAAYQPIEYLFLATAVIINVLFPLLARAWAGHRPESFHTIYGRGTELLVIVTAFVPVTVIFLAPALVETAFGPAYAGAAAPLAVLSVALVVMTVNAWQSLVLLAGGYQRVVLRYNLVALAIAVVSCTAAVRVAGVVGAAASALGTGVLVLAFSTRAVRRRMQASLDAGRIGRITTAAAATAAVVAALSAAGAPWLLIAIGAAVPYAAILGAFGFHRTIPAAFA
ncbi:oligosaccharide flippase family protein [Pengzhenrongella sicca]|uniref:Oligosaccharide flippase family protein n=1 Tax=Pengzhenrongella sicca TaxID=2819238 RepID=A0A8A4ZE19_9MICO|nr:oligosaccharide flippase family protein [Pengzhenrongella sicca]QTE29269.1 oligosaccharide flippase family protein [Pengzhenrongella sicca]